MATKQSRLLSGTSLTKNPPNPLCPLSALSERYRTTCVTTRTGLFVLVALAIVNAIGFNSLFYFITTPYAASDEVIILPTYSLLVIELLMFPVVGLLGEVCCKRFKLLFFGNVLIIIGLVYYSVIFGLWMRKSDDDKDWHGTIRDDARLDLTLFTPYYLLVVPGVGIFQANALQYGVDQLDFASSEVLSSFVYWYYWTSYAFIGPIVFFSFYGEFVLLTSILCATAFLISCLLLLTIYCCYSVPYLRSDPGHKVNPLKLLLKMMQFVWHNKFPLCRSAFTYNEMPSRLDLAKKRYGGPFTTEEVESVKSFWRILLVLASLIGFQLQDDTLFTMTEALFLTNKYCSFSFISAWTVIALAILILIPVYQFGVRPYFSRQIPSMLTRMGIGLIFVLLSLLATTTYNALISPAASEVYVNLTKIEEQCSESGCEPNTVNISNSSICDALKVFHVIHDADDTCFIVYFTRYLDPLPSFYWLAIPQILNGFAHILVFLTTLEFILAQAPRIMQGFLIGLWYAMQSVNFGISIFAYSSCAAFHWEYYATKSLLVSFSLVLFAIVAHKYKYRQLNEDVDINIHQEVENVFERNFDRKAEYENLNRKKKRASAIVV